MSKSSRLKSIRLTDSQFANRLVNKYGWFVGQLANRGQLTHRIQRLHQHAQTPSSQHINVHIHNNRQVIPLHVQLAYMYSLVSRLFNQHSVNERAMSQHNVREQKHSLGQVTEQSRLLLMYRTIALQQRRTPSPPTLHSSLNEHSVVYNHSISPINELKQDSSLHQHHATQHVRLMKTLTQSSLSLRVLLNAMKIIQPTRALSHANHVDRIVQQPLLPTLDNYKVQSLTKHRNRLLKRYSDVQNHVITQAHTTNNPLYATSIINQQVLPHRQAFTKSIHPSIAGIIHTSANWTRYTASSRFMSRLDHALQVVSLRSLLTTIIRNESESTEQTLRSNVDESKIRQIQRPQHNLSQQTVMTQLATNVVQRITNALQRTTNVVQRLTNVVRRVSHEEQFETHVIRQISSIVQHNANMIGRISNIERQKVYMTTTQQSTSLIEHSKGIVRRKTSKAYDKVHVNHQISNIVQQNTKVTRRISEIEQNIAHTTTTQQSTSLAEHSKGIVRQKVDEEHDRVHVIGRITHVEQQTADVVQRKDKLLQILQYRTNNQYRTTNIKRQQDQVVQRVTNLEQQSAHVIQRNTSLVRHKAAIVQQAVDVTRRTLYEEQFRTHVIRRTTDLEQRRARIVQRQKMGRPKIIRHQMQTHEDVMRNTQRTYLRQIREEHHLQDHILSKSLTYSNHRQSLVDLNRYRMTRSIQLSGVPLTVQRDGVPQQSGTSGPLIVTHKNQARSTVDTTVAVQESTTTRMGPIQLDVVAKNTTKPSQQEPMIKNMQVAIQTIENDLNKAKVQWSKPNLDMNRLADHMYKEFSRRIRMEQQRRGI